MMESDATVGQAVNVGSNFEVSIGDTARVIADVMGADIEIIEDSQRLRPPGSEVERLWADNSKALKLFGWQPVHGGADGFRKGIKKTADWFLKSENLALYKVGNYAL